MSVPTAEGAASELSKCLGYSEEICSGVTSEFLLPV